MSPKSEYWFEGLMLKLKLQNLGHLMWRADSLEKTPMLGKIENRKRSWWQRKRRLHDITDSVDMCLSKLWETVRGKSGMRQSMGWQSQTRLCNGTTTTTNLGVACPEPHYLIWIDLLPNKVYLLFLSFSWGNHQWWINLNWIFTLRSFWSLR